MSALERKLIALLTTPDGMNKAVEMKLSAEVFEEPICRAAAKFAMEYPADNDGKTPTPLVIETEFPGLKLPDDVEEACSWLIAQLQRRYKTNQLQEMLRSAASTSVEDPDRTLGTLRRAAEEAIEHGGGVGGFRRFKDSELANDQYLTWLAKDRIPKGVVSLLIGEEGIGKSLLWVWIVAALTTGKGLPEFAIEAEEPKRCLLVITEDDWSRTVRPRLWAAGADLNMVEVICREADGTGVPTFPNDMHAITQEPHPEFIIIDAWLDTVPAKLSVRDTQQARQALQPWKDAAAKTGAAIMLLAHTNRIASGSTRDKYGATLQLRKVCRMTLFAQQDDQGRLVVGPDKANLSRSGVRAAAFVIDEVEGNQRDDTGNLIGVPRLRYDEESGRTAAEWLAVAHKGDYSKVNPEDWLAAVMALSPQWASDVKNKAEANGITEHQLNKAKRRLNITPKRDGKRQAWYWTLPTQLEPPRHPPLASAPEELEGDKP